MSLNFNKGMIVAAVLLIISGCNNSSTGISQADFDALQAKVDEAKTMAAEARDIAQRAEQKADQALAAANAP